MKLLLLTSVIGACAFASGCGSDSSEEEVDDQSGGFSIACPVFCEKEIACGEADDVSQEQCEGTCRSSVFSEDTASDICLRDAQVAADCFESASCEEIVGDNECDTLLLLAGVVCRPSTGPCDCSSCGDGALIAQCELLNPGCEVLMGTSREACCQTALTACSGS
ncbi:MAG: hypothetical protein ACFB9M_12520 [Myxococcota bacterium]